MPGGAICVHDRNYAWNTIWLLKGKAAAYPPDWELFERILCTFIFSVPSIEPGAEYWLHKALLRDCTAQIRTWLQSSLLDDPVFKPFISLSLHWALHLALSPTERWCVLKWTRVNIFWKFQNVGQQKVIKKKSRYWNVSRNLYCGIVWNRIGNNWNLYHEGICWVADAMYMAYNTGQLIIRLVKFLLCPRSYSKHWTTISLNPYNVPIKSGCDYPQFPGEVGRHG